MSKAVSKANVTRTHGFLAGSYTAKGKKPLVNYGGNFWGINRNRCTIIPAEEVEAMIKLGLAERNGSVLRIILPGALR